MAGLALYYFKNKSAKELTIIYSNRRIDMKSGQGVEMLYLDEPISQLIHYDITLFNSGKEVISYGDFESGLTLAFENLGLVSQAPGYESPGVGAEYRANTEDLDIAFDVMRPNDHMMFEVLMGGRSSELTAPLCESTFSGSPLKIHQQAFTESQRNSKYEGLVKQLSLSAAALCVGLVLLVISFISKYQAYLAEGGLSFKEQLAVLLRVESLPWFLIFVVAATLLFFAIESAKVITPKFKRYKFEQLIQNRE